MTRFLPTTLRLLALLMTAGVGMLFVIWLSRAFGHAGLIPYILATPGPAAQKAVILAFLALVPPLLILAGALFSRRLWKAADRLRPGLCRSCGYDLTGNVSGVCPECGGASGEVIGREAKAR
jgi:hypothetical protein